MRANYQQRLSEYHWFADRMRERGDETNFNSRGGPLRGTERPPMVEEGCLAEEAIHRFESTGKMPDTREPEELYWLLLGKYARDWHVTQWGAGLAEGVLRWQELLEDGVPEGLVESARQAGYAMIRRRLKESA